MFLLTNILLTILICSCALIGDYVESKMDENLRLSRALVDNGIHAIIGGLTWLVVSVNIHRKWTNLLHYNNMWQVLGCTMMSSFIDLDHFISARSFSLQDATNLNSRPLLHSTAFISLSGVIFILITILYPSLYPWGWIWMAAALSHHTRDAVRRGYSLFPWGETPTIPKSAYLLILATLPHVLAACVFIFKPNTRKINVEEYLQMEQV